MPTMKAIRVHQYGGPEQLRYEDAPAPEAGSGQVLVRVHAASVNPWDYKLASGMFQKMVPMELPYVPGGDFSGVIAELGRGVGGLNVGDAVYGNCPRGAYAQLTVAPAEAIAARPAHLNDIEAASVPVAAQTAWQGLFEHGQVRSGQMVLIHAASGGVGSFAVQFAHWRGARVLATGSESNTDYLRSLGADVVIDYKTTPFETVAKDINMVFDLVGGETQSRSFGVLKAGGILVATSQPPSEDQARRYGIKAMLMNMRPSTQRLKEISTLLDEGAISTSVTKTFPLEAAREAWEYAKSGHTRGKVVLEVPS